MRAILFDAYGTLFDVHSVVEKCEQLFPQKGRQISEIWRQKQLEYTWLRTLMGRYEDFWTITNSALVFALLELDLQYNEEIASSLLNEYLYLNPFREVPQALKELKETNTLGILSNGSPMMLQTVVENAGLSDFFTDVISVDELKIYKPYPEVYQLGVSKLRIPKEDILFITSNSWDAAGAKSFGFNVCWINRFNKQFDQLGLKPDFIIQDLSQLRSALT